MGFVQVLVYPLAVDAVAPAVSGERLHIPRGLLEFLQIFLAVVDNHILVVDVVTGKQQPHGGGEGEAAVRTVGGEFLVADVGSHLSGHILRVGEGVQAQAVVTDAHFPCREVDVLQGRVAFGHEREVTLYQPSGLLRPDKLVGGEAAQPDKAAVVHDALELFGGFHELPGGFPVQLLRDDMSPAQRTEVALHPVTFLRRLGQVEIAGVFQVRTLVEVSFKGAAQKAHVILLQFRLVAFLDEPVLLMHDAEVRQHLDSLAPAAVYCLVLRACHGIKLRQFHLESHRDVGVFGNDAAMLHRQQRELVFQCCHFGCISHVVSSFRCRLNNRVIRRRLIRYRGWLLAAPNFISPCSPYRAFSAKVCHTRTEDDAAPKPIHIHWSMPTI